MTSTNPRDAQVKTAIQSAIQAAVGDVAVDRLRPDAIRSPGDTVRSAHSKRFVGCLARELLRMAQTATPATAQLIQAKYLDKSGLGGAPDDEFLWDIFVGQYGTAEDGTGVVLVRGLWAVESELNGGYQRDFNKLMVANTEHRLFVLPIGSRQLGPFQNQCSEANVACWIAEVSPLDVWTTEAAFQPWVKVQFIPGRR